MTIDQTKVTKTTEAYTAAWNSGSAEAVAAFYAPNGQIAINRGEPFEGQARVAEMAAGFFADVPDLTLSCDGVRCAGDHVVYLWTFTGTHSKTNNPLKVSGWEEWDIGEDCKVIASRGWFDAEDYARQVAGT